MAAKIELIPDGSVTSAAGFVAGGTYAGLKTQGEGVRDLGILLSERPASLAATFSTNRILSPSVTVSRARAERGSARAVVANSGCANCSVGDQGRMDAEEMVALAAGHVGVDPQEVLVASTGMIGVELPMGLIRERMGDLTAWFRRWSRFRRIDKDDGLTPQGHGRQHRVGRPHGDTWEARQRALG